MVRCMRRGDAYSPSIALKKEYQSRGCRTQPGHHHRFDPVDCGDPAANRGIVVQRRIAWWIRFHSAHASWVRENAVSVHPRHCRVFPGAVDYEQHPPEQLTSTALEFDSLREFVKFDWSDIRTQEGAVAHPEDTRATPLEVALRRWTKERYACVW